MPSNTIVPPDSVDGSARGRRKGIPAPWLSLIVVVSTILGQLLVWLACRTGRRGALRIAGWITRRLDPLTRRRRQANLRLFFPDSARTTGQLRELDDAHLAYLARMRAEIARCFVETPEDLKRNVRLEGEEHLQAALARKRGVLFVSGHTGTWWFAPAILAARGYPVTAIFTPIKFPKIERKLLELAARYRVRIAFIGRDAFKAVRQAIERNEVLYLSFDVVVRARRTQDFPFGAASLPIDTGPAILAVRHAMPTLQAACAQLESGRHSVSFHAPGAFELAPQTASPDDLCRLWTRRLEKEVLAHPEQWWPWGYVDLPEAAAARKADAAIAVRQARHSPAAA